MRLPVLVSASDLGDWADMARNILDLDAVEEPEELANASGDYCAGYAIGALFASALGNQSPGFLHSTVTCALVGHACLKWKANGAPEYLGTWEPLPTDTAAVPPTALVPHDAPAQLLSGMIDGFDAVLTHEQGSEKTPFMIQLRHELVNSLRRKSVH
jgi:hypothetical protein